MKLVVALSLTSILALLGCATTGDTGGTGTPPTTHEPGGTATGTETGPGSPGGAGGETTAPPAPSTGTSPGGATGPEGGGTGGGPSGTGIPGGTGAGGDSYGGQAGTGVGSSGGRASGGITSQDTGDMTLQRREFRTDMVSRLQRIEDRVRTLESQGMTVNQVQLRDLKDQHRMLQSQLGALDQMSDDAWFRARDEMSEDLATLERRVEDLDNQG